ncbi:MAG: Fe2+-dependent dioxygenase [Alphaproteobacteria bacterium]|nr:Fe2+-dependent dioxygenase [Alphaproteobacteria bacterium]
MILCIDDLIGAELRQMLHQAISAASFVDGRVTAGPYAAAVKRNMQLDLGDPRYRAINHRLAEAMFRHKLFARAVRPRRFAGMLIGRYGEGMEYGTHFDEAVIGAARTDVSFTLFLSDPQDYEGGALVIESAGGTRSFKLPPGAAVIYPSGALHRVERVTAGCRLVAAGWVQSLVRDPAQREILYDLDGAAQALFEKSGKTPEFDALTKSSANLMRMWTEL